MSELDEEVLPFLEVLLHSVPDTKGLDTLRASAVLCIVCNHDVGINVGLKSLSPSSLRILVREILVRHGGITHETEDYLFLGSCRCSHEKGQSPYCKSFHYSTLRLCELCTNTSGASFPDASEQSSITTLWQFATLYPAPSA